MSGFGWSMDRSFRLHTSSQTNGVCDADTNPSVECYPLRNTNHKVCVARSKDRREDHSHGNPVQVLCDLFSFFIPLYESDMVTIRPGV